MRGWIRLRDNLEPAPLTIAITGWCERLARTSLSAGHSGSVRAERISTSGRSSLTFLIERSCPTPPRPMLELHKQLVMGRRLRVLGELIRQQRRPLRHRDRG